MRNPICLLAAAAAIALPSRGSAQSAPLTLADAIEMAQRQGLDAEAARLSRDAARARDRSHAARLRPNLTLAGSAPVYNRAIVPVVQPDGSTQFVPQQQTDAELGLTVAQRLPFSGGTLAFTSFLKRVEFTGAQNQLAYNSTPFQISLTQSLLRPNTVKWDNREQDVRVDVAERQYLEAREAIALQTSNAFFDVHVAAKMLENATANAAINDTLFTLNKGRFEVGRIGENELLQSELVLLQSRSALENARLDHERALASLRRALNLPAGSPLELTVSGTIPDIEPDPAVAVAQAMANRALVSEAELQRVQAARRLNEARLNNGMGGQVQASVGFNQRAPDVPQVYQNLQQAERFSLGVQVPLVHWGVRGAEVQAATAEQSRVEAAAASNREQAQQLAYFAARQLSQAKRNVALTAIADTVAAKRFEVAYNRYVIGRIGIDNLFLAQGDKDRAVTQYLQALRNYWSAYYQLRQLTLYDFEAGAPIR